MGIETTRYCDHMDDNNSRLEFSPSKWEQVFKEKTNINIA